MALARLVSVFVQGDQVHAAVRVENDTTGPNGKPSAVEYNVTVPLNNEQGQRKPTPQIRAELTAAAAALRRKQLPPDRDTSTLAALRGDEVDLG